MVDVGGLMAYDGFSSDFHARTAADSMRAIVLAHSSSEVTRTSLGSRNRDAESLKCCGRLANEIIGASKNGSGNPRTFSLLRLHHMVRANDPALGGIFARSARGI
jgi:transcriptional/translational regulatory protein YebC/TACO1